MEKEKVVKRETKSEAEKQGEQTPSQENETLTDNELDDVVGGVRDAASGLPTGQRMHKPFNVK